MEKNRGLLTLGLGSRRCWALERDAAHTSEGEAAHEWTLVVSSTGERARPWRPRRRQAEGSGELRGEAGRTLVDPASPDPIRAKTAALAATRPGDEEEKGGREGPARLTNSGERRRRAASVETACGGAREDRAARIRPPRGLGRRRWMGRGGRLRALRARRRSGAARCHVARGEWRGSGGGETWRLLIGWSEVARGGGHVRCSTDASGGAGRSGSRV